MADEPEVASASSVPPPVIKRKGGGRPKKIHAKAKPTRVLASTVDATDVLAAPPASTQKRQDVLTADLHEFSTDGDLVDIWTRRMLNPKQREEKPIRLLTPGMHLRWINLSNQGRYQRARYEEGWMPVTKDELKDEREIYGVSFTTEGWVCRGERQQEMLMKIPEVVYTKIRKAKIKQVTQSNKKIKDNMQSAGAKHFGDKYNSNRGDEIAETLGNFKGSINFGTENVEPDEDDLVRAAASVNGE